VNSTVIEFEDVSFSYGGVPVVAGVDLAINERDFVYVIGPNGSGKTTLLRLTVGLILPQQGTVRVFGLPPEKARDRIGYVAQSSRHDAGVPMTVKDVVLMGRLSSNRVGRYGDEDLAATVRILERLQIADLADRPFSDLSGGQKQRVLIARALVSDPDLVLLDEPTANIDASAREGILDLLEELREEITIVMVSHDVGFVPQSVNKVVCVNRKVVVHPTGEITAESVDQVFGRQMRLVRHDRLYCEVAGEDV
jgi:zinc transport system ATP-binding protein